MVERDVGPHLAFIFEVGLERVEQLHRIAQLFDVAAWRIAESGIADERHARVLTHAPGECGRANGNRRILFGGRTLGDGGIGLGGQRGFRKR